jgi:integrase
VLSLYALKVAPRHSRPKETIQRISELLKGFGFLTLAQIDGQACRDYADKCSSDAAARRQLEELRAAINFHRREGKCSETVDVVLPPRRPGRERWLTRDEAARLIWSAWRYKEKQLGEETPRKTRQHVARFWLVALYTGTRSSAICEAQLHVPSGGVHLAQGLFFRAAAGKKKTKKSAPPVPVPRRLLAHMRRWHANGQQYIVEFNGQPVKSIRKASAAAVKAAGLGPEVTPHIARHTCATWLMQAGVDVWEAAGYLGMTVETLTTRYGHHHPKHLEGARKAFE